MDWHEDDEMMRQWEEVTKEEEKFVKRKTEGNGLQINGVHRAPQLVVSSMLSKEKGPKEKERKGKVVGWSKEKMEEKANNQLNRDTQEIVSWRSIHQVSRENWEGSAG